MVIVSTFAIPVSMLLHVYVIVRLRARSSAASPRAVNARIA
jgi:hypothetical protein